MTQMTQAMTGDWHPDMYYPYWSVIPPYQYWQLCPGFAPVVPSFTSNKTFWDHIEIAKEAREAGKRMRRYRRIR